MRTRIVLCVIAFAVSVAQATDVVVELRDGSTVKGDLLAVRDSTLIVAVKGYRPMWDKKHIPDVAVVRFDSVRFVKVKGDSYGLEGAGLGLVAGVVVGGLISSNSPKKGWFHIDYEPVVGGLAAAAGLVIGSVVGSSISSPATFISDTTRGGFLELKKFSRYVDGEPDWLEKID